MKRIYGILLACVLLLNCLTLPSSAAVGSLGGGDITSFNVSGDPGIVESAHVKDAALIGALEGMLSGTGTSLPAALTEVAAIAVERDRSGYHQYTAGISGEDIYLYANSSAAYKVAAADFFAFLARIPGLYKYGSIPAAVIGDTAIPPQASEYIFTRLDGKWYKPRLPEQRAIPVIEPANGALPLPTVSPAPNEADVRVIVSQEGTAPQPDGTVADALLLDGTVAEAKAFVPPAGTCRVRVTVGYNDATYQGGVTYVYDVRRGGGAVDFTIKGGDTNPGEVVVLRALNVPQGSAVTIKSDIQFTPSFFNDGQGGQIALLPVSYFTASGEHYVEMSALGVTKRFGITAGNKQFQVQHLTVSAATAQATILSQEANTEFNNAVLTLRWINDSTPHWQGRFLLPVTGARVTTAFGAIRYTNGSASADRHGGVDLAAPTGTLVAATNSGRVLYAGNLKLTGNTVLIEHGYGLKSWYYHMDKLAVKTGDIVTKSQKIGEVGATGFVTGPHLHFAISVNNVFVNPYTVIETDLLAEL